MAPRIWNDFEKPFRDLDDALKELDRRLEEANEDIQNSVRGLDGKLKDGTRIRIRFKVDHNRPKKRSAFREDLQKRTDAILRRAEEREEAESRKKEATQILADDAQVIVTKVGKGLAKKFGVGKIRRWLQAELDELKEDLKNGGKQEDLRKRQRRQDNCDREETSSDSAEKSPGDSR